MDNRIKTVIDTLLTGTADKRFTWEPTERKTEYRLRLQNGIVTVDRWSGFDEETGINEEMADITFYNVEGANIERIPFGAATEPADYAYICRLHEAARRNSLKIDETLSRIFTEIDKKAKGV